MMTSLQQQQQQQQQQVNNNPTTANANANVNTSDHPSTKTTTTEAISIAYDPEISPIPDQQAYVILDLYGTIIRSSSTNNGVDDNIIIKDASILYKMIVESTSLVLASASTGQEKVGSGFGLNRMTITFDNNNNNAIRYVIARDENHIYLVQTTTTSTK
jgi:hypothetical protein